MNSLYNKRSLLILGMLVAIYLMTSCSNGKLKNQGEYIELRNVVLKSDTGYILKPGDSITLNLSFDEHDYPVKRNVRVRGATLLPKPNTSRSETTFRSYCFHIDDYLDSIDGYKERYSLAFLGEGEEFPRNAFYRLSEEELVNITGKKVQVNFPVKRKMLRFSKEGHLKLKLLLYSKQKGRSPDDIYDDADEIWELDVPEGSSDWEVITKDLTIPQDIACILVQISSQGMYGKCNVGTPSFKRQGVFLPFYPIQPYINDHKNWIGENLSTKEWPEFEFALNGIPFYKGKIFDRASMVGEFEIELPEMPGGKYEFSMKLLDRFPAKFPFMISTIEILENSARDFEVVFVPEFVKENSKFGLLIEVNKPDIQLTISGDKQVEPLINEKQFSTTGVHPLVFNAGEASLNQNITISDGKSEKSCNIGQIIRKNNDDIYLSNGDDIYIGRTKEQFTKYLKWYLREGIGDSYCWRPSYQWSGVRVADPDFYNWAVAILKGLQMPYSLMTEGRTISGRAINPPDDIMESPLFMGRQAHEDDGSFYYWQHFAWEGLYSDLAAKFRPYGGIFAKTRPLRTDKGNFCFYDPYGVKEMEEGALTFVKNLGRARGNSTRHTGPSTLFRYFFQAGYDWVGAELMYGPDEVIMSSLRGACKAYNKKDFGTHLATQWGSSPYNTTDHAVRLFLSCAISYIHGANHINTEDGLWNIEAGTDRFSEEGKAHAKRQRNILHYIQTHERRGSLVAPIAVIQGRNDAWKCFVRGSAWSQNDDEWKFGAAEESFDLLSVFYPNSVFNSIYKHAPESSQGWYTATPYGLIDLLPIEAPQEVLDDYEAIVFLGWNTYQKDDFERMLSFVQKGKTLILSGNHINTELRHNQPAKFPGNDEVLKELLGENYKNAKEPYRNHVGKGEVIFYPQKLYPAESPIRDEYIKDLKKIGANAVLNQLQKGWIEEADHIEFAVWDWPDSKHRTIYLLNIDWWSDEESHPSTLIIGDSKFSINVRRDFLETITVFQNIAIMPQDMKTDVLGISKHGNGYQITVQTTGKETINIYHKGLDAKYYQIENAGIHKITVGEWE